MRDGSLNIKSFIQISRLNIRLLVPARVFREITAGVFDFGASDGPMDDAQLKEYRAKRGMTILHFPTVLGADVPIYNIPGVAAELKFTPEALAGIFLGKITKWDDPRMTKTSKSWLKSSDMSHYPRK